MVLKPPLLPSLADDARPFGCSYVRSCFSATVCSILVFASLSNLSSFAGDASLDTGWKEASNFLFDDAHRTFVGAKRGKEDPERELGEAVTLLNVQPRTQSNIESARGILERLAARTPADPVAIHAKFWLGRLLEAHANPVDPERAKALYWELVSQHGGSRIAEAGAASRVLLDIYAPISVEERAKRFEALEGWPQYLKTPSGKRNFHLNIGFAYLEFAPEGNTSLFRRKAIEHLKAADAEGITRAQIEALAWIGVGELAAAEGDKELAKEYYQKFLNKYRRDNRYYTISKRLAALEEKEGASDAR